MFKALLIVLLVSFLINVIMFFVVFFVVKKNKRQKEKEIAEALERTNNQIKRANSVLKSLNVKSEETNEEIKKLHETPDSELASRANALFVRDSKAGDRDNKD